MTDYTSNANKNKEGGEKEKKPPKDIQPVVKSEVIVQKPSLGRKIKDLFVEADFRSVANHVVYEVLIPAARNMIVDGATRGVERLIYGESAIRQRRYGPGPGITPRYSYNNPINRGEYRDPRTTPPGPGSARVPRRGRNDYILTTREDANLVLERMGDILDVYEIVSVADLNELVGFPSGHTDNKWGWDSLVGVVITQVREGYLIDLPPAEAIQ